MLFAWGMLVGLTFLFVVPRNTTGRLQDAYARVFRWPLAAGNGLTRVALLTTAQQRTVSPQKYEELSQAYQRVNHGFANVQAQLQEANKRVELLTKLRAQPGLEHMQPIPAGIVTLGKDELTINRGQESGVAVGQCVLSLTDSRLDHQCVIGIVSAVYSNGARIKLITDSKCPISVTLGKLSGHKWMEGRGDGTARIRLVPSVVQVGEMVYAERRPGFLEAPVVVAQVTQCKRGQDNPQVWDITVQPVCDFTELQDVVVLKPASAP
jgi:cell shape-determining protein MreC